MAPKAFSKDYLLDKLDELWVLRENMHVELDWSYEGYVSLVLNFLVLIQHPCVLIVSE